MRRICTIICILFFTTMLSSCDKEELNEDFLWYRKAETGCLDPWDSFSGQSDSNLKGAVKDYLNEINIEYDKIVIGFDSTLIQYCKSCACTTGRFIELHAASTHQDTLNQIGFSIMHTIDNE